MGEAPEEQRQGLAETGADGKGDINNKT